MQVPPSVRDSLTSSYQQYKEDTDTVASWLTSTARSCGYPEKLLLGQNTNNAQKPGSQTTGLQGKARKEAKQATNSQATEASSTPREPAYIIAIKDFICLAEFIAAKKRPTVTVPLYFAKTLDRAISIHKQHGRVAASHVVSEHSNESHAYFVGKLERVKEVLAPLMPVKATKQQNPSADPPTDEFANSFAALSVEEPNQAFLDASDIEIQQRPSLDYEAEQLNNFEEAYNAFELLLEDFRAIRQVVDNLWVGYKYGQDFARALENYVSPLLDKHDGSSKLLESLQENVFEKHNEADNMDHSESSEHEEQSSLYTAAEQVMSNAQLLLQRFMNIVGPSDPSDVPFFPSDDSSGRYDPTSHRESKTPKEKVEENSVLLMEFLSMATLHVRAGFSEDTVPEDELIRGLRLMLQTGSTQLWNILSVQLFLDIHHILRQFADRPFHELRKAATHIEKTIDQHLDFHKDIPLEEWPKPSAENVRSLKMQIHMWIRNDPHRKFTQRSPNCPEIEEFLLFRIHPVLCGLWMYRFQVVSHEIGASCSDEWGVVTFSCHLYHAIRHEKLLDKPWEDMETLIELQSESIFGNRRPKNYKEYLRRYLLAAGVSASHFAKDFRVRGIKRSKISNRGLAWQAPLTRIFRHRYCENSHRVDSTPEEIRNIMEKTITWADDGFETNDIGPTDVPIGLNLSRPSHSPARREAKNNSTTTHAVQRVPIPVLLKRMCNALQGETSALSFDHLRMHRQRWNLLQSIRQDSLGLLRGMDPSHVLDLENQLPQLVGFIFSSALDMSKLSNVSNPTDSSEVSCPLLAKSANAIEALIDRGEGCVAQLSPLEGKRELGDKRHLNSEGVLPPTVALYKIG